MLSDKISRKPRFNTYWELEAVPTGSLMKVEEVIPLPWKHVFSGSGNVPIPSNIFPHSPLILVFWNNRGKTVSTTNTVLKQFLSVWCQMSPSNSMLLIPTSVPSPTSLLPFSRDKIPISWYPKLHDTMVLLCNIYKGALTDPSSRAG